MKVDIIDSIEVKRFTKSFNGRTYEDDTIHLNSGQKINANYVEEESDGTLRIYVSDDSIIQVPKSLAKSVKYDGAEFVDQETIEKINPPRSQRRGGGCCGGR